MARAAVPGCARHRVSEKRAHAGDAVAKEDERRPGAAGFIGSGAVKHDVAVSRDFRMAACNLFGDHGYRPGKPDLFAPSFEIVPQSMITGSSPAASFCISSWGEMRRHSACADTFAAAHTSPAGSRRARPPPGSPPVPQARQREGDVLYLLAENVSARKRRRSRGWRRVYPAAEAASFMPRWPAIGGIATQSRDELCQQQCTVAVPRENILRASHAGVGFKRKPGRETSAPCDRGCGPAGTRPDLPGGWPQPQHKNREKGEVAVRCERPGASKIGAEGTGRRTARGTPQQTKQGNRAEAGMRSVQACSSGRPSLSS